MVSPSCPLRCIDQPCALPPYRFCLASYLTLPFRAAPLEGSLIPTIERGLAVTDRIGLLGEGWAQLLGWAAGEGCGGPEARRLQTRVLCLRLQPWAQPERALSARRLVVHEEALACSYPCSGASVTQHPEFSELLDWLMAPERQHVRLSIASVRTNTVTPQLAAALSARWVKRTSQGCLF